MEEKSSGREAFLMVTRVHIFCEGQTEETFVREVLRDHFNRREIFITPILLRTSATGRGGIVSYKKVKKQVEMVCKNDPSAFITSMIDLYGLPSKFPKKNEFANIPDPYQKVEAAEKAFAEDISQPNFIANLLLHEYEALLFSDVLAFENNGYDNTVVTALESEAQDFETPEHINDSPQTAPSKRILRHCNNYNKPLHGSLIAIDIGLDIIREKCSHFDKWLSDIEALGGEA